ncbi:MAG: pentapeptide repeat-containing protein [Gammaproteobacteria bacterium]
MRLTKISSLVLMMLVCTSAGSEIYKWKDVYGNIQYGDRPPADVEKSKISAESFGPPQVESRKPKLVGPKAVYPDIEPSQTRPPPLKAGKFGLSPNDIRMMNRVVRPVNRDGGGDPSTISAIKQKRSLTESITVLCAYDKCIDKEMENTDFGLGVLSSMRLDGSNLSGSMFSSVDHVSFIRARMRGVDFSGKLLNSADFSDANLSVSNNEKVTCNNCTYQNAILTGANMANAAFLNASFRGADLRTTSFKEASFINVDLRDAHYSMEKLLGQDGLRMANHIVYGGQGCDIGTENTQCRGLPLKNLQFGAIKLQDINFQNTDLSGADFTRVDSIDNVGFAGADLQGVTFTGKALSADFSRANLSRAQCDRINLNGYTSFKGANLEETNFSNAGLELADFTGANLRNANLTGSRVNLLAFDGAITDGCKGCPERANNAIENVAAIKTAMRDGWRFEQVRTEEERKQYLSNLRIIQEFQTNYHRLNRKDLKEVIIIALQSDDAGRISLGQKILSEYDHSAFPLGIAGLCKDPDVIQASLGLLDFVIKNPGERDKRKYASDFSTDERIRLHVIDCVGSAVNQDRAIQQIYMDHFDHEPDHRVQSGLLAGFAPEYAKKELPRLLDIIKMDKYGLRSSVLSHLSKWDQPPVEAMVALVGIMDVSLPARGGDLIASLGARSTAFLPAITKALNSLNVKDYMKQDYLQAIKGVELLGKLDTISDVLPTDPSGITALQQTVFERTVNLLKLKLVDGSPEYITGGSQIKKTLALIPGGESLTQDSIRAVAKVEYQRVQYYEPGYVPSRIGMMTIIFDSAASASAASEVMMRNLKSRRKLALQGSAVHVIWWRYPFDNNYSDLVIRKLKKIPG